MTPKGQNVKALVSSHCVEKEGPPGESGHQSALWKGTLGLVPSSCLSL